MAELIYFDEIRIRKDLTKAYAALSYARTIKSSGGSIPDTTLTTIEKTIELLEKKLNN